MKQIIAIFLLSCFVGLASSQQITNGLSSHQIGLSLSDFSGALISYSFTIDDIQKIKAVVGPWFDSKTNREFNYDITLWFGGEYQVAFLQTYSSRFYGLVGVFHGDHLHIDGDNFNMSWISGGLGVGVEYYLTPQISVNAEYGIVREHDVFISRGQQIRQAWSTNQGIGFGANYRF